MASGFVNVTDSDNVNFDINLRYVKIVSYSHNGAQVNVDGWERPIFLAGHYATLIRSAIEQLDEEPDDEE